MRQETLKKLNPVIIEKGKPLDFPDGPVAKTPCSQCRGPGLIPGQGTRSHMLQLKIPHAATNPVQPNK